MRKPKALGFLYPALVLSALFAAAPADAGSTALKEIMKQMGKASAEGDAGAMTPIFDKTKAMRPSDPSFAGWDAIAERGRAAAAAGDVGGAKATCKECHEAYRDTYKAKFGSKAP